MLPGKRAAARGTLFMLIGGRGIEYAILEGGHGKGRWRTDGGLALELGVTDGGPLAALCKALQALPPTSGVDEMRVLVADSWVAMATLPWSDIMRQRDSATGQARLRLAGAGFTLALADVVRVDDASFGVPRLAVAYPADLLAALVQVAARSDAVLASVLPLSVAGWNATRQGRAAASVLVLAGAGIGAIAHGSGGARLQTVTVRSEAGAETVAQVQRLWERACLRDAQLAAMGQPGLLDLAASDGDHGGAFHRIELRAASRQGPVSPALQLASACAVQRDGLDAIGILHNPSRAQWALLACAFALTCAALGYAVKAGTAAHALQAALEAPQRVSPAPPAPEWSPTEATRIGAVNAAVRQLNLPFDALLRALAPAPDLEVAVLSVATGAVSGTNSASSVKIVAEARTRADMARYAALVAQREPFVHTYIIEHELDSTVPERRYRFTLEATWQD